MVALSTYTTELRSRSSFRSPAEMSDDMVVAKSARRGYVRRVSLMRTVSPCSSRARFRFTSSSAGVGCNRNLRDALGGQALDDLRYERRRQVVDTVKVGVFQRANGD